MTNLGLSGRPCPAAPARAWGRERPVEDGDRVARIPAGRQGHCVVVGGPGPLATVAGQSCTPLDGSGRRPLPVIVSIFGPRETHDYRDYNL